MHVFTLRKHNQCLAGCVVRVNSDGIQWEWLYAPGVLVHRRRDCLEQQNLLVVSESHRAFLAHDPTHSPKVDRVLQHLAAQPALSADIQQKSVSMAGKLLQICTSRPPLVTFAGAGIGRPAGFPDAAGHGGAVQITAAGPPDRRGPARHVTKQTRIGFRLKPALSPRPAARANWHST